MTDHGLWIEDEDYSLAHPACGRCERAIQLLSDEEAVEAYRLIHGLPKVKGWVGRFLMWMGLEFK